MGEKGLQFDFSNQDLSIGTGALVYIEGARKVLQDIALELNTLKGSLPLDPEYGSFLKGALNSQEMDHSKKENEAKRIAHKHPAVEYGNAKVNAEEQVVLTIKLFDSWGGGLESTVI